MNEFLPVVIIILIILVVGFILLWKYSKNNAKVQNPTPSFEFPAYDFPTVSSLSSTGKAYLEVLAGPAQGEKIPVYGTTFLIERRPESVLKDDLRLSRNHAVLEWRQGVWHVRDLNSTNGTYLSYDGSSVNEQKLTPEQLVQIPPGAVLRFGGSRVRILSGDALNHTYLSQELLPNTTLLATVSYGRDASKKLSKRYEFKQKPIKGGFALVFEGKERFTGEKVGLKVLTNYTQVSRNIRRRFEQEGALNLNHPHIVQIYDWGQTHDGPTPGEALYILMEWMDGNTLRKRMKKPEFYQKSNLTQIVYIVDSVCQALDYAHQCGIIHRDIKPENIMFTKNGVVKVVDFGVAHVADGLRMTEIGTVIGTPNYMSPEQAVGNPVAFPADIYSIAAVTFELLTKHRLFEGDPFKVIEDHIKTPPRRPSSLNAHLSTQVDDVLLRALDKNPGNRFGSATEFSSALAYAVQR